MNQEDFLNNIPDSVKRDIDCLDAMGFNPGRALREKREAELKQQQEADLLLPESCKPKIGEFIIFKAQDEHEAIAEIRNIILSTPEDGFITFDYDEEFYIVATEIALSGLKDYMAARNIRIRITERMLGAVISLQRVRDRRRFKGFGGGSN